ncbi:glycoside hydrolase family protein [Niabella soli]|uniref:Glycosylase n=1 Tax=Niabella soli DSM 19437 TaxID=929713 RepID=W0F5U3_9BACT|nr:glycosylase [Niabella soli]AHF16844.1 glycosylase [Niabella soli DSM 19437]
MRKISLGLIGIFLFNITIAQRKVPQVEMQKIYEEIKTPYKYGLVVLPPDTTQKVDCPTVYKQGNTWYMTYVVFNGHGYETWLSASKDLLHWKTLGKQLVFTQTGWDANQEAGYNALVDTRWGGDYNLGKFDGKYWMSYIGGATAGYEPEPLSIGMAYTTRPPVQALPWQRLPAPVLSTQDADVRWWENRHKLFKSYVIEDKAHHTGHRFIMYYNAVGDSLKDNKKTRWYERIGMAVSNDMVHWKRYLKDPVVHHPAGITGDPMLQRIGHLWVMFYFGAFWTDRPGAFNRFACSYDLIHWTDWTGDNLIQSSEDYDQKYAHKSFVLKHNGVVYHFYCAVDARDHRGIAVATSVDKGRSKIGFINGL